MVIRNFMKQSSYIYKEREDWFDIHTPLSPTNPNFLFAPLKKYLDGALAPP